MGSKGYWISFFTGELIDRANEIVQDSRGERERIESGIVEEFLLKEGNEHLKRMYDLDAELTVSIDELEAQKKALQTKRTEMRRRFNAEYSSGTGYYDTDKSPRDRLGIVLADEIGKAISEAEWSKRLEENKALQKKVVAKLNMADTPKQLREAVQQIANALGIDLQ